MTPMMKQYHAMKEKLPKTGQKVATPMGAANVVGSNPLKETVLVELESKATVELPLTDIKVEGPPPQKRHEGPPSQKKRHEGPPPQRKKK